MILSHDRRFIFLKTRKTAGTSIELALSNVAIGERDIVTPVSPEDEAHRPTNSPPRNYLRRSMPHHWRRRALQHVRQGRFPTENRFSNHDTAAYIHTQLPREWAEYQKFAFVRNPWDRAVSALHWMRHRRGSQLTMDQFLDRWQPLANWDQITLDGVVAVDRIYRFETLLDDVTDLFIRIGAEFDGSLPGAKTGVRADHRHYSEVLTRSQAERIAESCRPEIEAFGYRF